MIFKERCLVFRTTLCSFPHKPAKPRISKIRMTSKSRWQDPLFYFDRRPSLKKLLRVVWENTSEIAIFRETNRSHQVQQASRLLESLRRDDLRDRVVSEVGAC